jgi:hypothetical protein
MDFAQKVFRAIVSPGAVSSGRFCAARANPVLNRVGAHLSFLQGKVSFGHENNLP